MRTNALRMLSKLALAGLLILPFGVSAVANEHFEGGRHVIIVPRYSYSYPYWGGWGWGWGAPYWGYGPYYMDTRGTVKIKDRDKFDEVFINDAYAGTADKMKTIKLDPGTYNILVRRDGKNLLNRSVYVVAGRTVEIRVEGS